MPHASISIKRRTLPVLVLALILVFGMQPILSFAEPVVGDGEGTVSNSQSISTARGDTNSPAVPVSNGDNGSGGDNAGIGDTDNGRGKNPSNPADDSAIFSLADFLTDDVSISYGGQELTLGEDGKFAIHPDTPYQMRLHFREKPEVAGGQIPVAKDLVYKLPAGLQAFPRQKGEFSIDTQSGSVNKNTYEVKNNVLQVRLQKNAELEASKQAEFFVTFDVGFKADATDIAFTSGITMKVRISNDPDLSITKTARHDFSAGKVFYTVVVKSIDTNENVEISDQILGSETVLRLDTNPKNLRIKSNKKNAAKPGKPVFANNGFKLVIPKMTHKEEVTITYAAFVDYSKVDPAVGGTLEQTTNKVKVTTEQIPTPKETENNLQNQLRIGTITKDAGNAKELAPASGIYDQPWVLQVNEYSKLKLAGYTISDSIPADMRALMEYSGTGIKIVVNKGKKNAAGESIEQIREVPWAELENVTKYGWSYRLPASDPEFSSYEISYTTKVDVSEQIAPTAVKNEASSENKNLPTDPEKVITSSSPLRPPHEFKVEKKTLVESTAEVTWQIIATVVPQGYKSLVLQDTLPAITNGDKRFQDILKANTKIKVEGLLGEESYTFAPNKEHPERGFQLIFYKDAAKTQTGLLPYLDKDDNPMLDEKGMPAARQVKVTFTTANDKAWIQAYRDGNHSMYRHINQVKGTANGIDRNASAVATPDPEGLSKSFQGIKRQEIGGVDYPVFNYRLQLEGLDKYQGETLQIVDRFDSTKLKLATDPRPHISDMQKIKVNEKAGEITFIVKKADLPHYESGEMYSNYYLHYSLLPRDRAALDSINKDPAGIKVKNNATWGPVTTHDVPSEYNYAPLTKEVLEKPSSDNGYVATFQIILNPGGLDIAKGAASLELKDEMTNLRLQPETLKMTPEEYPFHPVYRGGILQMQVPNKQKVEITYKAKVIGDKVVNYTNKVTVGGQEQEAAGTVAVRISAGGFAPNPGITLHKHDGRDLLTSLAGAEFALYRVQDGKAEPVVGKLQAEQKEAAPLRFVTDKDGNVTIKGDEAKLGWALLVSKENEKYEYELREVKAPVGYRLLDKPLRFIIADLPKAEVEQYDGAVLYVANEALPNTPTPNPGGKTGGKGLPQTGAKIGGVLGAMLVSVIGGIYLIRRQRKDDE